MSELIHQNRGGIRWQLLTTVSALSLTLTISAHAESSDKPSVWIELGGQLERIEGREDTYLPPFTTLSPTPGPYSPISPTEAQKASIYSYGIEGSMAFHPRGTEWSFTAAIRYGRSNNNKHVHQQTKITTTFPNTKFHGTAGVAQFKSNSGPQFADFKTKNDESHTILDFQVGHDVGLGFLSSTASLGIRMAEFSSTSDTTILARPHIGFVPTIFLGKYAKTPYHTDYQAMANNARSFQGVGPSISWNGDIPVIGGEDGAITVDFGVNGALLFGRQKAKGSHHETASYYTGFKTGAGTPPPGVFPVYKNAPQLHDRSRSVTVPNVGFLAGLSFRYPNAKVSFGYRADLFFGAMDMGIDERHTVDRTFHGPFATVSIGLGG